MANKKNKKKASQQKAQTSAAAPAAAKNSAASKASKGKETTSESIARAKSEMKAAKAKEKAKAKKNAKPGIIDRVVGYFRAVRSEMKVVTWPTKSELINYSLVVCASLVVVGVVIAALDFVIGEGLFLISGLRG